VVVFDSWYFCSQIVEAVAARGWDWVTQAEANRIIHLKGEKMNVTGLAERLPAERFRAVKVKGEAFSLRGFRVWMPKLGDVRLVVSREVDGFHFYASNRLDWSDREVLEAYKVRQGIEVFIRDVKQNLGLEEYQMRGGRGAIIHWHLVFTAYTLLALLRRSLRRGSSITSPIPKPVTKRLIAPGIVECGKGLDETSGLVLSPRGRKMSDSYKAEI
jgi:hypothetical protein